MLLRKHERRVQERMNIRKASISKEQNTQSTLLQCIFHFLYMHRGYYTVARTYEVYLRVKFFNEKMNFICSSQRVIFFLLHRYECFENLKKNGRKTKENKGMTSEISSLVRILKISYSYPGCSFVQKIRFVYFSVKHSYLCNTCTYFTCVNIVYASSCAYYTSVNQALANKKH